MERDFRESSSLDSGSADVTSVLGEVYLNGCFMAPSRARVSLFDRGYLLGDGVFDTLRTYGKSLFAAAEHVARFRRSADAAGIPLAVSDNELCSILQECVARARTDDIYVRMTITRGVGGPGISVSQAGPPALSVMARPLPRYAPIAYLDGIDSIVLKTRRIPAACLNPSIKSIGYLPTILARRELEVAGLSEGVQLSIEGEPVSGTVSNLFWSHAGQLMTPALSAGALPGVTRSVVLQLARDLGLRVTETEAGFQALQQADEVAFTSTVMGVLPVRSLDGRALRGANGPVVKRLSEAFDVFAKAYALTPG